MVDGSLESPYTTSYSSCLNFFRYRLRLKCYKAKRVKTRCYQEWVGHLEPRFLGRGRPWGMFFGFYKTRHILLSDSANCTVLRAVVLTQYRRVIDIQTDGIAVASTALAKRRAVKANRTSWKTWKTAVRSVMVPFQVLRTLPRTTSCSLRTSAPEIKWTVRHSERKMYFLLSVR